MEDKLIAKSLQMLSRQIKREMDVKFQNIDLTGVQATMLHFIYETSKTKKVYAKDIENEFDMRRATIAELLQSMEQNNLIERKAEESDGRMKEVILTKNALEKVNCINLEIEKLEKQLSSNISKEELSNFFEILNKISNNL